MVKDKSWTCCLHAWPTFIKTDTDIQSMIFRNFRKITTFQKLQIKLIIKYKKNPRLWNQFMMQILMKSSLSCFEILKALGTTCYLEVRILNLNPKHVTSVSKSLTSASTSFILISDHNADLKLGEHLPVNIRCKCKALRSRFHPDAGYLLIPGENKVEVSFRLLIIVHIQSWTCSCS